MKEKKQTVQYVTKAILAVMVIVSVFAGVTKIFTGFDIDEAYALAIPYRVLQGDRLFADMWEVHQTSFLLPYLFLKLFYAIGGSMDGVVLYTRVVTTVLHLVVSFVVYRELKRNFGEKQQDLAAILALIYFNFLPKWMINLDFSMQQLWFFTLFLVFFWKSIRKNNSAWLMFVAGVLLAFDVLAYPGMVFVYAAAVLWLFIRKEKRWQQIGGLTAGCAVSALVFFVWIFTYMTPRELIEAVPKVFMDGSHQYDMMTKLGLYVSQWLEVLIQAVILLIPTLVVTVVGIWLYSRFNWPEKFGPLSKGLFFCIVFEGMVSLLITLAGLITTWGPFRLQVRYIIQFVMAFVLYGQMKKHREAGTEETEKWQGAGMLLWFSLASFVGILIASNVGPVTSSSYLVIGNMVFCGLTVYLTKNRGKTMQVLSYAGVIVFLCSLVMCKGFYMRNTEYVPGDISEPLQKVEEGPLAGVYVPVEDYERYTSDYQTIQQHTTEEDYVLFMGTEGLSNLYANGKIVIPTTISTPAFNEQWVDYFETAGQEQPTIIFIAQNTIDDRDKFFVKNVFGIWIAERYDVECMEETDSLCILRKKR